MATKYDADQLAAAAARNKFTGSEVATITAIALAESGGRHVTNDSIGETPSSLRGVERCASYGPFQINYCPGRDAGSARETAARSGDLDTHAAIAYSIYREQGWRAWTMYRNGTYKRYMQVAREAAGNTSGGDSGGQLDAATGAVAGGLVGGIPGAIIGGVGGAAGGQARDATQGLIRRYGQLVGGTLLVGAGLVILLRDVAPELAAGALTGGGSVAATAATAAAT